MKKDKSKWILAALFFAWIVSYVDRTAISLALVNMGKDLQLTETQLGLAISAFFIISSQNPPPSRNVVSREGMNANPMILSVLIC